MRKPVAALLLLVRFLIALLIAGLQTVWVIVKTGVGAGQPPIAFLRVRYAPMSPAGAAILGSLVSLTPGTTTIDIDLERRELLLHVLDASDVDGLVAGIRRDFEPGLVTLFGERT